MNTKVLPFIIFITLAASAYYFEYGHFLQSKAELELHLECQSSTSLYRRSYVGLKFVDEGLCLLVTFFQLPMAISPMIAYLFGTALPFILFTCIEARRPGQHRILAHPFIWLFLTQCATFGLVYPFYALVLVTMGTQSGPFSLSKHQAISLASSIILGAVIPTVLMIVLEDPIVTWIWQFYPLFMFGSERLFLQLFPKKWSLVSGYPQMKVFYQIVFAMSASMHLYTLVRLRLNNMPVALTLAPAVSPPDSSRGLPIQLLHFFKWDMTMGATSLIVASLWSAKSTRKLLAIIAWYIVAIPVLGLGTAFMAVVYSKDILDNGYIEHKDN